MHKWAIFQVVIFHFASVRVNSGGVLHGVFTGGYPFEDLQRARDALHSKCRRLHGAGGGEQSVGKTQR